MKHFKYPSINNLTEKDMKIDGLEVDFDGKENKYISNIIMSVYFK